MLFYQESPSTGFFPLDNENVRVLQPRINTQCTKGFKMIFQAVFYHNAEKCCANKRLYKLISFTAVTKTLTLHRDSKNWYNGWTYRCYLTGSTLLGEAKVNVMETAPRNWLNIYKSENWHKRQAKFVCFPSPQKNQFNVFVLPTFFVVWLSMFFSVQLWTACHEKASIVFTEMSEVNSTLRSIGKHEAGCEDNRALKWDFLKIWKKETE